MNTVEFLEAEHIYLLDGVITPSVSQLLKRIFAKKYQDVPTNILKAKAEYGTRVHKLIEMHETGQEIQSIGFSENVALEQYMELKSKYNFEVVEQEQVIHYNQDYCGTFDIVADINFFRNLIDIKTTAKLDVEYLSWQLGMYKLAYENMGKGKIEKCYCVWLPKNKLGEFIEVKPKTKKEILEFLKGA